MHWKLKVSGYGKIKSAEIEVKPLTLFVGDNNSGKSYLMSLLWGIRNFGIAGLLGYKGQETREVLAVADWVKRQLKITWQQGSGTAQVNEIADELRIILREGLICNKDHIIRKIFNSSDVRIKELQIELIGLDDISLGFMKEEPNEVQIKNNTEQRDIFSFPYSQIDNIDVFSNRFWVFIVLSLLTGIEFGTSDGADEDIYLPAARTGFMLTKDIINKVGRNVVFNLAGTEPRDLSPFTRPINQFLDVMNDLTFERTGYELFDPVVEYLERGMVEGNVEISSLPNKEISYVPSGQKKGLPLRAVSAVVTELSPLILILKYKKPLDMLFYEEPEMCLHPQLQQKMGKVICQLVNAGLGMVVTTHSDIILQHINNMLCLSERKDAESICGKFGYTTNDLLNREQIKVYQLKSKSGGKTTVEELECGENGFVIPTFNDALDRILDEGYAIQE